MLTRKFFGHRAHIVALVGCFFLTNNGCSKAVPPTPAAEAKFVVIDAKSGALFRVEQLPAAPLVHPQTGQPTLMPALYCPKCRAWHEVPPLDVLQRNPQAGRCVKTRAPLETTGPLPASATVLVPPKP